MHVSRLFIYPVKSAAGIEVQAADIDDFGFHLDRRWMFVRGRDFLTAREDPRLLQVKPRIENGTVILSAPMLPDLPLPTPESELLDVAIWNDTAAAHDCGDEVASWLQTLLGDAIRLVFMPNTSFRRIDPTYCADERRVGFADGYPFLLVSEESVSEVSRRSGVDLSVRRFRPNIVVANAPHPHAEDDWRRITIGGKNFSVVKPCDRCVLTTIDPDTGTAGREPLKTLATYRKVGSKVLFGQNVIHDAPGRLAVGDPVTVSQPQ